MHAQTLICFGSRPGDGNPALVIEDDGMDATARQAFAAARNTTCVFLSRDGEVDYFYPHMRSPLCLHATLAVAAVLLGRGSGPGHAGAGIAVRTAATGQVLPLAREGAAYFVKLAPQPAPQPVVAPEQVAALLGAPGLGLVSAPRVASVGSPKLLVEVRDADTLYRLAPDLAGITAWGKPRCRPCCKLGCGVRSDGGGSGGIVSANGSTIALTRDNTV